MSKIPAILIVGLIMATFPGRAQQFPVTGTVVSLENLAPLPGVTVLIKGTARGTVTDPDGRFNLTAESADTLVFSFVGMETQTIPIRDNRMMTIILKPTATHLGETVVVGYSTDSRKLITGAIGIVKEQQIDYLPVKTVNNMLQGQVAGLIITQNSGVPEAEMKINIRGHSSLFAGVRPLFILDGIPILQSKDQLIWLNGQVLSTLTDLDPGEMESFTVLKDAGASAIYGARGANGVVLMTSKKGQFKAEKPAVDFSAEFGFTEFPAERRLKMLNSSQYIEYQELSISDSIDTDWLSEVLRKAPLMNVSLSVAGGGEKTRFFISGSWFNQDGIVKKSYLERYNGRANFEYRVNKNISLGFNVALSKTNNKRTENDYSSNSAFGNTFGEPPIYPVYDADGQYNESGPFANPVAIADNSNYMVYTFRSLGNIFANFIIIPGLQFNTKWGFDRYSLTEDEYDPVTTRRGAITNGILWQGNSSAGKIVSNNVLSFNHEFREKHTLDALLGYSFEQFSFEGLFMEAIDFPDEKLHNPISAGSISSYSGTDFKRGMNSFFGQVKYDYRHKLLASFTIRADGSSKFGENNKYGYFPAGSLAWRISREKFMRKVRFINDLKVRIGYGVTGNDGIPDFQSLGLYAGHANYNGTSGIAPCQLPNPDLKWESTQQTNIGLDFSAFHDRISFTVDAYYNYTSDLLYNMPIPTSTGFATLMSNIGELENKGVELGLNTLNLDGVFKWSTSLNMSFNRNQVTNLNGYEFLDTWMGVSKIMEGQPIGIYWGYRALGVDPATGDMIFADVNGDGVINSGDMTIIGNPQPQSTGGLTNIFTCKNFELTVFLYYSYGNDLFSFTKLYSEDMNSTKNQLQTILGRWRRPGDITDVPRATEEDLNNNSRPSSRYVEDGSYIKIRNITLAYNFGPRVCKKLGLRFARVYFTVNNLYTFTHYHGMDPEINWFGESDLVMGVDFFTMPLPRGYTVGLNIGF